MLVSSVLIGMGFIFVHDSAKSVVTIVNLHYSYLGHMFISSLFANFQPPVMEFSKFSLFYALMFLGVVVFALLAQYMIFASSGLKKPSHVMPFGYASIVTSFLADVYLFGTEFTLLPILGIVLTSIGLLGKYLIEVQGSNNKTEVREDQDERRSSR
jgi:drug/metabolite transporter (DMT)-like permease